MKMLKSVLRILFVISLIYGGASAYSANTATASSTPSGGRPDLEITENGSGGSAFQLPNVVPGDSGSGGYRLTNAGSLAGELSITFSEVVNTPGNGGEYADGSRDLGAAAEIAVYFDADTTRSWSSGDVGLKSDGTTYSYPTTLEYDAINQYSGVTWNALMTMMPSATGDLSVTYRIPITAGNEIQGDGVSFDVTFLLQQKYAD